MVLPLPLGTVLRQRYVVQEVLGQGGFGRTYLALDQERFNEQCVLKEFIVPYQDEALVEKSKTLFQREASTLYQIQHPQVPRFWAAFEDEQRLFLVQSYIEGHTYRRLLSDRKQQETAFAEVEVVHLLSYLLPVLSYLHDRGIVHRDISPENIILQPKPLAHFRKEPFPELGLPVLIDFGAVKEATSHWPLTSGMTRVGKVGYAPPEQLQTGKVYPNSDLYALAATSLALLTGREPRSLLDSQTLSWQWQTYAELSDELGMMLQRMLSVFPGDRYQSANAVLADLQPLLKKYSLVPSLSLPAPDQLVTRAPEAKAATPVTLLQPPESLVAARRRSAWGSLKFLGQRIQLHSSGSQRLKLAGITTALVGIGIALPLLWQRWILLPEPSGEVWVSGAKLPQSEASQIIESQGTNSSNSALKDSLSRSPAGTLRAAVRADQPPQLIVFPPNQISTIVQGNLQPNEQQAYSLKAAQGQIMTVSLAGSEVQMNLLRSNQEAIDAAAYQTRSWTGQLPADDQYLIQVAGAGAYSLDIAITPINRPSQNKTERLAFAPGTNGTTVTGTLTPHQLRRYLLAAKQGQLLVIKVLQGNVKLGAIAPNGQRIGGSSTNSPDWQGRVPGDGDYVIEVSAAQANNYALSFELF